MRRLPIAFVALAVFAVACSSGGDEGDDVADTAARDASATSAVPGSTEGDASAADPAPPNEGDLGGTEDLFELHLNLITSMGPTIATELLAPITAGGQLSSAWVLTDVQRFYNPFSEEGLALTEAIIDLGVDVDPENSWQSAVDDLIARDVPEPDEYPLLKRTLLGLIDGRWESLFAGGSDLDWRILNWGGVFIDDREFGDAAPCFGRGCIPALDDPGVVSAAQGDWYPDDRIVFGVVVNGEARAYPKNIMEVHEMVNDELGGRRIGMPYCTLCGSAQAYFTDEVDSIDETDTMLVLRTSGLLSRSNKVMYDLVTGSVFDTFTGRAVTGSLFEQGYSLSQITVRTSTWGDWKRVHPDTTIVAADGGIGRIYPEDPLLGRDDDGPIFPIGDLDPRLGVHDQVVGVVAPDGRPVAFDVAALAAQPGDVTFDGVTVRSDGAGYLAFDAAGEELVAHQAFWFAWSQFWPDTSLWPEGPAS